MSRQAKPPSPPQTDASVTFVLGSGQRRSGADRPLPAILRAATRSARAEDQPEDPLLAGVVVDQRYTLAGTRRGAGTAPGDGECATLACPEPQLLALENEDGGTLFIRSDALAEAVAQIQPDAVADGVVDLSRFTASVARARGFSAASASAELAAGAWRALSVLRLPDDGIAAQAAELARRWAAEQRSGEALGAAHDKLADEAYGAGSVLGAKALMWLIESRLAGNSGLYRWTDALLAAGDRCTPCAPGTIGRAVDARLADAAQGKPMLVLIHGTASNTVGAFADLRNDAPSWRALCAAFPGGIFGFEHRTFSESPVENALELLHALPDGANVSLLTHSRGGLVGDLLCLGAPSGLDDAQIEAYRVDARDGATPADRAGLERAAADERARLRAIRDRLRTARITVQRYVRVAAPARGTRLLSQNLDAALSDFLNVVQWGGSALLNVAGPAAGVALRHAASSCLGVLKRLVLEIAARRIDAHLVPGIAAMCIDSPLAALLANAANPDNARRSEVAMAVIAGDTEFDSLLAGGLTQSLAAPGRRIASLFCDWRLFERNDNDLVVDTDSMYAGIASRRGTRYLFDQDASVSHFRYFANAPTRDALCAWLVDATPTSLAQFAELGDGAVEPVPWSARDRRRARSATPQPRPVAIIVPGIMGTHLALKGRKPSANRRIWFNTVNLALGELSRLSDVSASGVVTDDLFELIYGELADHLAATHAVLRCPYDWRRDPHDAADLLARTIEQAARDNPGQPINLVVHSLGGLVARALIAAHPDAWRRVVASGGRLVMLGTPNNGAHMIAHTLLGKASAIRLLEKVDLAHDMQQILDIVAGFPGVLALLPRPGFADSGDGGATRDNGQRVASADYYHAETWQALKAANRDRWYGNGVGALPDAALLARAAAFWQGIAAPDAVSQADNERILYVFGHGEQTPCGIQRAADGRPQLVFTADGDGWVSWDSARFAALDVESRGWLMPVEHGDLTCTAQYFPAIVDLLERGATERLGRLPRRRGAADSGVHAPTCVLESAPPIVPSADELARALTGGGARRRSATRRRTTLHVAVEGGDLRRVDRPVLCGHYVGDAISGSEAVLDALLDGALAERERIGVYAAELGTSAIVLRPRRGEDSVGAQPALPDRRGARGAVIVGLGKFDGQLSARQITETVRAGVVRFLLQLRDAFALGPDDAVELYSVLIGWNSTASLSIAESVGAICRGVLEANHQFGTALDEQRSSAATVGKLTFIELYRHAAIAAAHAVTELPTLLAREQKRLGVRIIAAPTIDLPHGSQGLIDQLGVDNDVGHWSRLMVSDADATGVAGTPPVAAVAAASGASGASPASSESVGAFPERLKYVLLSPRARAETIVTQRQPGLVEAIVRDQRRNPAYDARLGRILFQLMVPLDYKALAREQARLLLVLDGYAARLPWELLQADDEPLVLGMPMIRQLATQRFRPALRTASCNSACLIAAPSTAGFDRRFGGTRHELDALPQAAGEVQTIAERLRDAGWNDDDIVVCPPEREALDVLATLYARPYRVLAIAAHGLFEASGLDGRRYSGVVLSDGLLLTAVEIEQMEVVPELVFINCCHLGELNTAAVGHDGAAYAPEQLAYSVARALVEMGVRAVVAAAWAVDDNAASTFAATFFDRLGAGESFGDAVFAARRATFEQHPASNTWGAYQAWGDPGYRLHPGAATGALHRAPAFVARDEALAALRAEHDRGAPPDFATRRQWVARLLARCPLAWADDAQLLLAVAALYAQCGEAGYAAARDAWLRALAVDDADAGVPLKAIEDLAALEIGHVEALVTRLGDASPAERDAARQSISDTLARLDGLSTVRAGGPGGADEDGRFAKAAALRQRALACQTAIAAGGSG